MCRATGSYRKNPLPMCAWGGERAGAWGGVGAGVWGGVGAGAKDDTDGTDGTGDDVIYGARDGAGDSNSGRGGTRKPSSGRGDTSRSAAGSSSDSGTADCRDDSRGVAMGSDSVRGGTRKSGAVVSMPCWMQVSRYILSHCASSSSSHENMFSTSGHIA